jgi:hypothetical protein
VRVFEIERPRGNGDGNVRVHWPITLDVPAGSDLPDELAVLGGFRDPIEEQRSRKVNALFRSDGL